MKFLLSVIAAAMLLCAAMSTPAEARCWWNGWGWECAPRYWGYYRSYYRPYGWGYHRHYWRHHRDYW
jgi:hypothetical protein